MSDAGPTCPLTPPLPAVGQNPADQAKYMAYLGRYLALYADQQVPTGVLIDMCRAIAVIGQAVTRADQAYAAGLADGAHAASRAQEIARSDKDL